MNTDKIKELEALKDAAVASIKLAQSPKEKQECQDEIKGLVAEIKALKKADVSTKKETPVSKIEADIMNKAGVDKIWRNSKGEYFTMESYARLSDDPKKIVPITRKSKTQ